MKNLTFVFCVCDNVVTIVRLAYITFALRSITNMVLPQ